MSIRFWSTLVLDNPPACLTAEEQAAIDAAPFTATMAQQHPSSSYEHAGYLGRTLSSGSSRTRPEWASMIPNSTLGSTVRQAELDKNAQAALAKSKTDLYYQIWKPTKEHKFPLQVPILPSGHDQVKEAWKQMFPPGSSLFKKYLSSLAIETNHLEGTFLITVASTQDLIRRGIADGIVDTQPQSRIHDASTIKSILTDTLAAYELLPAVVADPSKLTPGSDPFGETYIPPGQTHNELDYICKMAKQYIKNWRNPFATASWIHLLLARCHPFNDGNGRTARLISSIPLMMHEYPPLSIGLTQRSDYYDGLILISLNIARLTDGDHVPLIEYILRGMEITMASVRSI
ncbi:fido domain-containing protein [Armillaria novae-zelandiae]|uniref:Fido domain-containing protein n=1 Tax=Armillaria novae-zelandiae TaxID=153914 RepID=A0AA39PWR6_9AGAR|nr:fido domain-containing protein [Armillaria novae-zelandiae]